MFKILKRVRAKQAFGLVEIVIVLGMVIVLSALSIHGLLQAKARASDGSAIRNVESVAAAMQSYIFENSICTKEFAKLITAIPPYLSEAFSDGNHQGYDFWVIPRPRGSKDYFVYAQPEYYKITGSKFIIWDYAGLKKFDDYTQAGSYVLQSELAEFFPSPPLGWDITDEDAMLEGTCDSNICPPGDSEGAGRTEEEGLVVRLKQILCKAYLRLI
ncbi:type II secretion system protein [Candidatus Omnitrophota bacterium]